MNRYFQSLILFSCLWGAVATSNLQAAEGDASAALCLRDSVQVDSEGIYLDQLVTAAGNASVPHIRIAASPSYNRTTNYSRAQIAEALKSAQFNVDTNGFSGAEKVSVSRRLRQFSESDLLTMLTSTLQQGHVKERGGLELRLTRAWTPVNVPDENLELLVLDMPTSGVGPMFIVRFELRAGKESLGVWQSSVQAKIMREVWVARIGMRRGLVPVESDFEKQQRDVINLREMPADITQLTGDVELAESVTSGSIILPRHFKLRPVVRRGQSVEAVYQDGPLMISMKVELLEDGVPGQVVRVRNLQTRRDIRAKVVNEQVLTVNL